MKIRKKLNKIFCFIVLVSFTSTNYFLPNQTNALETIATLKSEKKIDYSALPEVKEAIKQKLPSIEEKKILGAKPIPQNYQREFRELLESGISGNVEWNFYDDGTLEFGGGTFAEYDENIVGGYSFSYLASSTKKIVFTNPLKLGLDATATFKDFKELENFEGLELVDTSNTYLMEELFRNTYSLRELDLSTFNTERVLSMRRMFGSSGIQKLNISNWNTAKCIDMGLVFESTQLTELDVSHFDLTKAKDLMGIFSEMKQLETLDLSNVKTSSELIKLHILFAGSDKISKVDLKGFDVSNVFDFSLAFTNMTNLTELDISTWDTSSGIYFEGMFDSTFNLQTLDLSHLKGNNAKTVYAMFTGSGLKEVNLSHFETPLMEDVYMMFAHMENVEKINISKLNTRKVQKNGYMFSRSKKLKELTLGPDTILTGNTVNLQPINTLEDITLTGGWTGINTKNRYSSSLEFTTNYDGQYPDTYVWEKYPEVINANNFSVLEKDLATADFLKLANASAYDVETNQAVDVVLISEKPTKGGVYPVTIGTVTGKTTKVVNVTVIDDNVPVITTPNLTIKTIGSEFDPLQGVQAFDAEDGDITDQITIVENTVDTSVEGVYYVDYKVTDSQNKVSNTTQVVIVQDGSIIAGDTYILKAEDFIKNNNEVSLEENQILVDAAVEVYDKLTGRSININNLDGQSDGVDISIDKGTYTNQIGEYMIGFTIIQDTKASKNVIAYVEESFAETNIPEFIGSDYLVISLNSQFDPFTDLSANDVEDGDLTNAISITNNNVDPTNVGLYEINYEVIDSQNNLTEFSRKVFVTDGNYAVGSQHILKAENFRVSENEVDSSENGILKSAKAQVFDKFTFTEIPINNLTGETSGITLTATSSSYGLYAGMHLIKISIPNEISKTIRGVVDAAVVGENTQPFFVGDQFTQINVNDEFNPLEGIQAFDNEDGEITNSIEIVENNVNTSVAGMYKVEYFVMDSEGLYNTFTRNVLVSDGTYVVGENYILKAEDFSVRLNSVDTTNAGIIKSAKVSVFDKNTGEEVIITSLARITSVDLTIDKGGFSSKVGDYTIKIMLTEDPLANKNVNATVLDNIQKPTIDQGYIGATSVTGTGIAGNTIKVMLTDGTSFNTVVNSNNKWKIILNNPLKKDDKITAVQINQSNEMSDSVVMTVTSYLEVPIINKPATGDTSISGTGTPGSSIEVVLPDGTTVETTVDENGNWTINVPPLNTGDKIEIIQENNGAVSEKVEIVIDKEITPTINQPYTGDKVLTGTGTPGSVVEITLPDGTTVETTVDENGNWQLDLENSLEENQEISIVYVYPNGVKSDSFKIKVINKNSGETPSNDSSDSLVETGTKNEINTQIGLLISFIILLVIRKTKNTQKQ